MFSGRNVFPGRSELDSALVIRTASLNDRLPRPAALPLAVRELPTAVDRCSRGSGPLATFFFPAQRARGRRGNAKQMAGRGDYFCIDGFTATARFFRAAANEAASVPANSRAARAIGALGSLSSSIVSRWTSVERDRPVRGCCLRLASGTKLAREYRASRGANCAPDGSVT